jgi:ferredoxin
VTRAERPAGSAGTSTRLRVDPVACEGIGMCAHLAPRLIGVDSWGYPQLTPDPLRGPELRSAAAAVAACPRRALFLDPAAG